MNDDLESINLGAEFARLEAEAGEDIRQESGPMAGQLITKEQQEAQRKAEISELAAYIKAGIAPLFTDLAPGWGVTELELDNLAVSYGAVIHKRVPGGLSVAKDHMPEIFAGIATVPIAIKAWKHPRKIEGKAPGREPDAPPPGEQKPPAKAPAKPKAKKPATPSKTTGEADIPDSAKGRVTRRKPAGSKK